MSNKKCRILSTILTFLLVISYATMIFGYNPTDFTGGQSTQSGTVQTVTSGTNKIIGIIQGIAIAAAVILLIILAIKYVSAAPSEKADVKKSAAIYIVGAVLLFGATGILGIINNFATEVNTAINK